MKRGRTAVKGNGTVGLTEGRKERRKSERKDYQLSVQSPAGFVIGGQSKKKTRRRKDGPVSATSQSTSLHPLSSTLISRSSRVFSPLIIKSATQKQEKCYLNLESEEPS